MTATKQSIWTAMLAPLVFAQEGAAMAYEAAEYVLLEETDTCEVRKYARYLVAETAVEGGFGETGRQAFRRLAGYIFGDNRAAGAAAAKR